MSTIYNASGTKHESSSITVIMDPVIIKSPNSLTVATGSDVSLTCVYSGTPKPYFFWNKNDEVSNFTSFCIMYDEIFNFRMNKLYQKFHYLE